MIALRSRWIPHAALASAVLALYAATLNAGFHFDDFALFVDPRVTSAGGWLEVWRPAQTRPLTYFTFWLDHAIHGRNPAGWHAFNVVLHLAAVLLLYGALRSAIPARPALVAAAIFAVHPVQAEPVAYVYARATLLMTLFCLLAWRAWQRDRPWRAAAWFALAVLAKEECAAFPAFLLLQDLAGSRGRRRPAPLGVMFALALAAGIRAAVVASGTAGAGAGAGSGIAPLAYLAAQGGVILRYLRLLVLPAGFTVDPDIALVPWWKAILPWGVILLAAALALSRLRRRPEALWFLGGLLLLLPSSSIFPAADLAADRRVYLPLAAWSAAAALPLARLPVRWLAAPALVLLLLTAGRVQVWHSEETLWSEAAARAPRKVRPRIRLARAVPPGKALPILLEAKTIAPDDAAVASELGRCHMTMGRAPEALAEFGRALALTPADPLAHNNRGVALAALGQRDAARRDFERALSIDPCLFDARLNLRRMGVAGEAPAECALTPGQVAMLQTGR